ncbi:MAG: GAF domain-containing protein [Synergistaceae bacterium]|jgi:GAF domain-containing protein|nr:GAF domain-containing protein [Synergistaceae bacterium]
MNVEMVEFENKRDMYEHLNASCAKVIDRRDGAVSSLANASALIKLYLEDTNWVGFYLFQEEALKLGPFQGSPAVTAIKIGEGVCGSAASEMKTVRVDDVKSCGNYIACDPSTSSEIVVPIIKQGRLLGVLDIDSPKSGRFDEEDEAGLQGVAETLVRLIYM